MKIKKALSIFLAALMLFTMIPMSVFAGGEWSDDKQYIDISGSFTKGQLYEVFKKNYSEPVAYNGTYIKRNGYFYGTDKNTLAAGGGTNITSASDSGDAGLVDGTVYYVYRADGDRWPGECGSFTARYVAAPSKLEKKTGDFEVSYIIGETKAATEAKIFAAVIDTANSIPAGLELEDVTITYNARGGLLNTDYGWYPLDEKHALSKSFADSFNYTDGATETVKISFAGNNDYKPTEITAEIKLKDGREKFTPVVADIPALTTKQDVDAAIKAAFSIPGLTANDYTFSYECSPAIKDLPTNEPTDVTVTYTAALKDATYKTLTTATVTKAVNITNEVAPATINVTQNAGGTVTVNGETGSSVHAFKGEVAVVATPDAGYYVSAIEGVELNYGDNRSVTYTLEVENENTYAVNVTFAKSGLVKNEGVLEIPFIIGQSKATSEKAIFDAVVNSGASIPAGLTVNDVKIEYKSTSVIGIGSAWYVIGEDPTGMKAFSADFTYENGGTEKIRITYAANSIYDSSVIETEIKLVDGRADATVSVSDAVIEFKNKAEAIEKAAKAFSTNGGAVTVTDITTGLPTVIGETKKAVVSYEVAATNGLKGTSGTAEISFNLLETPGTVKLIVMTDGVQGFGGDIIFDGYGMETDKTETVISNVLGGTYTINVYPLDEELYIKSIKIDGVEVSDDITYICNENGNETYFDYTFAPATEAVEHTIVAEFAERTLVSLGSDKEISYVAGAEFDTIKGSIFSSVVDVAKSVGVATIDDVEITTTADKADLVEGAKIPVTITAKATDRYPAVTLKETIVITYDRGTAEIVLPEELKMNLASSADATAEKITEYLSANINATSGAAVSFELGEIVLPVQGGTSKVAVTATAPETDLYKAASADFEVEFYGEIKDATFTGVTPVIENGVATFTVTPAGDEYIDSITVNGVPQSITTRSHTVTINKINGAGDDLDKAAPSYDVAVVIEKFNPAIKEDAVISYNPTSEVNDDFVAATEAAVKSALGVADMNATVKFHHNGIAGALAGYAEFGDLWNGVFKAYFGTEVEAKGTDTESIQVTIPENGKYPAFTKVVTIILTDSRNDCGIAFNAISETISYNTPDEIKNAITNNIVNPNGLSYELALNEVQLPTVKEVPTEVSGTITFAGNSSYKAKTINFTVTVSAKVQPCNFTLDGATADGTVKINGTTLTSSASVQGNSAVTITVAPAKSKVVSKVEVLNASGENVASAVSYNSKTATVTLTCGDGENYTVKVAYEANGSITAKDGTIKYCYGRDDDAKLKALVFNAVYGSSVPADLKASDVTIEYKPVGLSIGDLGWKNINDSLSVNINGITHNFGQKGSEKIRIKYSDAKYGEIVSNEATLTVIDTSYNVTINGLDSKTQVKAGADITVAKNGLYREKTDYTLVVTPNVLSKEFVADIIVKDAAGNKVNGAVTYHNIDATALESINAKTSFRTVTDGKYTVEVVYGTAAINLTDDTVVFDKYDGVNGKYSAKVPTDKEVFDALIVSAAPDFMAVYGAGHSIKYTVNGKEVALKDVTDGTTVNVTISYDNDGIQYQDVSASGKIVLVDPRTATSIETADLTEAVRFLSEDQLKSVLTEALKVKVIADGEELADADYILTVGEVEEADGKSYVDVTITYDGSESYKPAQLVLNNIEVTDVPEKTFVTIVSDGAQVLFNGKAGTSFEVVGNVNYTVKATPAAGYAIESIVVAGDDNTAVTLPLSYNSTVATAQFVAAEHVNYTVTVTSVPAKFDLAEDAKVPFRSGAEAPDVKVIYDAAVNAPARAEGADIKVKYLAREATTLDIEIPSFSIGSVEIPGRTLEIPLSELWLEVGEKIVPVTLDDLKSDPTNVQYLKYYGAREFGSNGDGSTEKIRVTYRDDKWNIAEDETTVTIADSRKITEIASLDSAAVKYGASGEDVVKAFEAVLMSEGAAIEGEIICKTKVAGLDVGSYEAVLAFAGNDDYRPCEKTVALKVEKAHSSVTINSQVAAFGSDINIDPVTDPEGINTIDFVIGVDVENDLEGYVQLRLPGKLGEYFSGEMSLQELSESLNKIANLGDDLLDGLGFSSETVNSLIQALESIAAGLELPNLRIKVNGDLVPANIGVYIVGAVTADGNYETSADVGYLVITPNATQVELDWIINDENGIITLPAVLSGEYDLRATVVQNDLSDEDFALAKEEVEHVFVGVNLNGEVITSREPVAQAGAYAELAYMLDWGNELFYAEPIVRAFVLAPETATVNFVDENNNNGFMFTYDGTEKSVEAEAVSMAGEAFPSDNISIYYYGVMNDGTTYNSKEAPVHAGAYSAIATYAETNENGDYVRVGMNVAAIAILPAESEVAVESAVKVYDGEPKTLNVTASPEEIDEFIIITAGISADDQIVTLSGTANVDFPERLDNLFKKYIPEAYENGVKLFEALPVIEKVEQLLAKAEIESEEITVLLENLKALPEGTTLTFKDNAELTDVGAYLVAAIVCEPDYIPSIDAGVLVIVPDVQTTTLSWNEVDENAVFTVEKAKAFDFGATAAAENVTVGTIFAGINADDVIYLSKEASASIGAYTEVAYTKDIDAITYIAKPIIRSYIIVPEAYTVEFVDANENGKFLREYDGTPKAVEAVAYDMDGNLANGGEMIIRYIGVEGDFEMYNSTVAPTNAGTYTVIADFIMRDEDGKLLGMGSKIGTLVITKTLLDFDVIDTTVTYDGKGHFADTSSAEATDYLAAIYSVGNVNVIFPEDMKNIVDLIPVKNYTAANLADEFSQLAAKVENANLKNALNNIAVHIAQYGNAGVVINGELPTDAGIYEIATVCVAENYITDLSRGTLIILPKDVTITIDNVEKVVGAEDPAFTYTVDGLVGGEDLGIIISREEGEEVGEYAITASYTADKNYNITVADGTLTITKHEKIDPEVTVPTDLTATYGDTLADVELPEGFEWKDDSLSVGNAGENSFTAIYTPADTDNYNAVEVEITITVEKVEAVVENAPEAIESLIADGTAQALIVGGTAKGGTMVYSLSQNGPFDSVVPTAVEAGVYTVYYKVIGDENHKDTAVSSFDVTVYPAKITSDRFVVEEGGIIRKITAGITVKELLEGINEKSNVTIFDEDGNVAADDALVATGMVAKLIINGVEVDTVTVVVTGDVNGDGVISVTDMLAVKYHILEKTMLTGIYKEAADTSSDDNVSITDFTQIKYHILEKTLIEAN